VTVDGKQTLADALCDPLWVQPGCVFWIGGQQRMV
jgi:hypothetical protein